MYSGHNKQENWPQEKKEEQNQEEPKHNHTIISLANISLYKWAWHLWSGIDLWANTGQLLMACRSKILFKQNKDKGSLGSLIMKATKK